MRCSHVPYGGAGAGISTCLLTDNGKASGRMQSRYRPSKAAAWDKTQPHPAQCAA